MDASISKGTTAYKYAIQIRKPLMKVYFKNLDAIRFIAALLVVLHHAQYFKRDGGHSSWLFLNNMLADTGRVGVNMFFVLSGFLISYLLLKENSQTGSINFKNFYIRRMLRIWPLYLAYGILLTLVTPFAFHVLGITVAHDLNVIITNLIFLILFAVNIQLAFFPYNKGIVEVTWSVCIEEQFYLIWPLLLLAFRKRLKLLFSLMLGIGFLCKALCLLLPHFFDISRDRLFQINYLLLFDKLELFGAGMFAAYLLFNKETYNKFLTLILHKYVQIVMLILMILVVFSIIGIPWISKNYFDHFFHAALFSYLMLMAVAENSILHLEYPLMKTLGKISYGIYLFHPPVCQLLLMLISKFSRNSAPVFTYELLYPILCVVVTCSIAYFSYEIYEKKFLKIKSKYASVQTRI
jgi:peptidoglycan/LPS O-acetylase OafA/YrhL